MVRALGDISAKTEDISQDHPDQRDMAGLYTGGVARLSLSLIRCTSMVVQAFSASASVLKGEPPTFMALRF